MVWMEMVVAQFAVLYGHKETKCFSQDSHLRALVDTVINILVSSKTKKGLTTSALSFAGRAVPCGVRGQIRKRRRTKETDYPAIFLLAITKLTCWSLRFSQRCC
jgi:hypothetical protein